MSTFGALNTAYRGLTAAQQGMNVAGQNIANAATEGYTRQRVQQSSIAAPAQGLFGSRRARRPATASPWTASPGLGSSFLDAGVRSAGAQAGYASVRSSALQGIEGILQEPGDNGISTALQGFWSAWQGAANQPDEVRRPRAGSCRPATISPRTRSPPPTRPLTRSGAASAARPRTPSTPSTRPPPRWPPTTPPSAPPSPPADPPTN